MIAKEDKLVRGSDLAIVSESFKTYIQNQIGPKFGSVYFDSNTNSLLFFKNDDDRTSYVSDPERIDLIISSIVLNTTSNLIYRVALTTENEVSGQYNTIQTSANAESLNLIMNFDIQVSTLGSETWSSTGQSARFKLYTIDSNNIKTEIPLPNPVYFAGQKFIFDIMPFLSIGTTRVEVAAFSESNNTITASFTYQIIVSEMYIEETNNNWYNAIVENGLHDANYKLGGFKIIGSMSKTLHIELYKANELVKSFERPLGQSSYNIESPYYFTYQEGFDMQSNGSNLPTGIYMVKAYLTSDTLTSLPVIYNIMYVADIDINSAQLVCVNYTAPIAYNYSSLNICDYAIYNKGSATGDPHLILNFVTGTTPSEKENKDLENTTTGQLHHMNYTVEWLTEDTVNLFINMSLSLGSSSQVLNIPIDNSATYPAETGAVFYLNSTTRNNTDTNKLKIVNEATLPSTEIIPTWTKMSWIDGIDGWTVDESGRKCLLIPAKSSMVLPYQILTGENITFEICYKVSNVVDYDENVITIASNPTSPGFHGIRIRPTNVTVHSSADSDSSKDVKRGTNLSDETIHHLIITIANTYSGNTGKNLVTGYVDGSVGFQFEYDNGTAWANNVPLIIGGLYSDVYVYFIRAYNSLLGKSGIEKNYINSLNGLALREAVYNQFYSIVKQSTHEITYENVVKSNKNFFVVEMLNDASIPSRANNWSKETKGKSNFEMHFGNHPLWDFKLYDVETAGQGTTSMDYYRWNLRFRIDKSNDNKKVNISYYNSPVIAIDGSKTYNEQVPTLQGAVYFDGGANSTIQQHPQVKRITAKINFASSMQSHKIGATRAYNALRTELGLYNAAQDFAASQDPELPKPVVAVYQYPAYGFSKKVSPQGVITYEYIGLYTIGPDKGDKPTFGYDINSSIKNKLITLEGTDHSRRLAKFLYPWNEKVEYRSSNECLNIVLDNSDLDNAWEVSNCYDLSTDKTSDQEAINTKLVEEFKPAYDLVYNNSTQIFPIALNVYGNTAESTLETINNNIINFRKTQYNSRFTYADMEFWIENEYVLYYYDIAQDKYVAGVNLITDLNQGNPEGTTILEQNEWFKNKRRERFKASAENYWDIQDSIYHFIFILWFGATDNFAKNTYPYKMDDLANGGRWCWRQDDLDTIFDIDNTGGQTKPYFIEYEDAHDGSTYFAGSSSVFWNLLYETYWEDYGINKGIKSLGKDFISAMATLGTGSNVFTGCRNFINTYFWNNAQNYFNQAAYNVDTVYKYESAWLANGQAVDPLGQSLGNHYSAEQLWVDRRIIYMMSLFKCGPFGSYGDQSLGAIQFRPQSLASLSVTPILNMYPALANGAGSPAATSRTSAGESYTFTGPFGDGNTTFSIQATDYLTSLGDWKDLELGTGSGGLGNVEINGKKLKTFKIGDETASNVTTNIPSVTFPNNNCLEFIDARNTTSLTGAINLNNCKRLIFADFSGTNITQVNLPIGSKIEELHLSDNTRAIILKNLNYLSSLSMPSDLTKINTLQIENCHYQDALDMLRDLYNTDNTSLQYIRIIWNSPVTGTLSDIQMLANIKNNKNKNGESLINNYGGISADGNTTNIPVIEGTIELTTGLYSTDLETLGLVGAPEVISGTIVKAQTEAFGTFYIIYDSARVYIDFTDNAVKSICMNNWSSDNIGVTMNDAANVTTFNSYFNANSSIVDFDEMQYFTKVTTIGNTTNDSTVNFKNCVNLTTVNLKNVQTLGFDAFYGCTSLNNLGNTSNINTIRRRAFQNSGLTSINFPNLEGFGENASYGQFVGCDSLTSILNLGKITSIPNTSAPNNNAGMFENLTSLTYAVLPNTLVNIGDYAFKGCENLDTIIFNYSDNPLTVGKYGFYECDLSNTTIPTTRLTSIGLGAFANTNLSGNLNLSNLTSVGDGAFTNTKITSINSLGNITTIPSANTSSNGCFARCSSLTEVTFPERLTTLGQGAFYNDTNLSTVVFDNSTENLSIYSYAFYNCDLTNCTLPERIVTINGLGAFANTNLGGTLYLPNLVNFGGGADFYNTKITSITNLGYITSIPSAQNIPDTNTAGTFANCTNLISVVLPNTLTFIGTSAFRNCTNLETVTFPSSITKIDSYAFQGCSKLGGIINLPNLEANGLRNRVFEGTKITEVINLGNITNFGYEYGVGPFNNCSELTYIKHPATMTNYVGGYSNCPKLTTLEFDGTSVPSTGSNNPFDNLFSQSSNFKIIVPDEALFTYKGANMNQFGRYAGVIYCNSEVNKNSIVTRNYGNVEVGKYFQEGYTGVRTTSSRNVALTDYIEIPDDCDTIFLRVNNGVDDCYTGAYWSPALEMYDDQYNLLGSVGNKTYDGSTLQLTNGTKYIRATLNVRNLSYYHFCIHNATETSTTYRSWLWPLITIEEPSEP